MAFSLDPATLCAHAGVPRSPANRAPYSHVSPLYQNSAFDFGSIEASLPALAGHDYVYGRLGSPNPDELGAAVAALEGGAAGLATSSGMGAIASAILSTCAAGDRVVVQADAYGGSHALVFRDLARFGVDVDEVDAYDIDRLAEALDGARVLLVESLANPLLREPDLAAIAALCRDRRCSLIVDNTFATPLRNRPLADGADLVVHSVTKFLAGHHDLIAGVVVGDAERVAQARAVASRFGLTAAPFDAWLAVRGLRTLELRMRQAWRTAALLGERMTGRVDVVHRAERCALLSFDAGDYEAANRVVSAFELITLTPSLGGVTTTASHPATSSHAALTPEQRAAAGIGDGLLRLSVGIEDAEDLWRDLERGLAAR